MRTVKLVFVDQRVLIDTWWNVNLDSSSRLLFVYLVLIDTWWNVNTIVVTTVDITSSVLIDTWWNVNRSFFV